MRRLATVFLSVNLVSCGAHAQDAEAPDDEVTSGFEQIAVLQALDKVTGRIFTVETPVGEAIKFGTLWIRPWRCYKGPPEEPPESIAFLEISEARPGEETVPLFAGWMFASSPGLSALEHPVYDVIILECRPLPPADQPAGADDVAVEDEPAPDESNE